MVEHLGDREDWLQAKNNQQSMRETKMGVKKIVPVDLGTMQISILCNGSDEKTATARVLHAVNVNGWVVPGTAPRVLVAREVSDMAVCRAGMVRA